MENQVSCQSGKSRIAVINDNKVNSQDLFDCCGVIAIEHNNKEFILRISDNGKALILK